jgi:hypothetical protein
VSLSSLLGLAPGDVRPVARLGSVIALFTLADFLVEGAVMSAFLARLGAEQLPAALAARAVVEVVLSVAYARVAVRLRPRRALAVLALGAGLMLAIAAALFGARAGLIGAFVAASVVARLKVIHFGVLALAELPNHAAARTLPAVYACARIGALIAGPLLALTAKAGSLSLALFAGAAVYALGAVVLTATGRPSTSDTTPPSLPFGEEPVPPTLGGTRGSNAAARLLAAIVTGAVALAVGRLALTTQSGAILAAHYSEAELALVLGLYFVIANALGLLLQLVVVGRLLNAGGLPILNTSWSLLYFFAQLLLAFGPAVVPIALTGRLVESELRNAARTPVANLLYEGLPEERRAAARTLVIGVAIPLASLAAGAGLALSSRSTSVLSAVGVSAAVVLLLATVAQNRAWRRARF